MNAKDGAVRSDEWSLLTQYFPVGWKAAARSLGAMRRARGIRDPAVLLRCLLVHLAEGSSLRETAARVQAAGWAKISSVGLFKRLRVAEEWLHWLAEQLWRQSRPSPAVRGRRVRVVDATTISEPGRTGGLWRVHYVLNLADLRCDYFRVSTPRVGERFAVVPVQAGDLLLGDRAYGTPPGVAHVHQAGGAVLVRINLQRLPLFAGSGRRISILARLRTLRVGQSRDWPAWVQGPAGPIAGRLVAMKRSAAATRQALGQLRRRAARRRRPISPAVAEATQYVFVWTSLPEKDYPAPSVMELYRLRWQIELTFKRLKSLLAFGHLPKHSQASSRAWIYGKLFVALLTERLIEAANLFSPWGYHLEPAAQPLARNTLDGA